jgi:hypothetical protein
LRNLGEYHVSIVSVEPISVPKPSYEDILESVIVKVDDAYTLTADRMSQSCGVRNIGKENIGS